MPNVVIRIAPVPVISNHGARAHRAIAPRPATDAWRAPHPTSVGCPRMTHANRMADLVANCLGKVDLVIFAARRLREYGMYTNLHESGFANALRRVLPFRTRRTPTNVRISTNNFPIDKTDVSVVFTGTGVSAHLLIWIHYGSTGQVVHCSLKAHMIFLRNRTPEAVVMQTVVCRPTRPTRGVTEAVRMCGWTSKEPNAQDDSEKRRNSQQYSPSPGEGLRTQRYVADPSRRICHS